MDKPHKQVVTSYPVAIKSGQGRVHIPNPIPWHAKDELVKCPQCDKVFIMTVGFPKAQLLAELERQHKNNEEHPDVIPCEPNWTTITDCDCGF